MDLFKMTGILAYISHDVNPKEFVAIIALIATDWIIMSPQIAERFAKEITSSSRTKGTVGSSVTLTQREWIVLNSIADGLMNKGIADRLGISENTAKVHVRNIMEKLHAHTRQEAVSLVRRDRAIESIGHEEIWTQFNHGCSFDQNCINMSSGKSSEDNADDSSDDSNVDKSSS